jgi:hypothetical protein
MCLQPNDRSDYFALPRIVDKLGGVGKAEIIPNLPVPAKAKIADIQLAEGQST